jgi:hypothetical protein
MAKMNVRIRLDPGVLMYLVIHDKLLVKYGDLMKVRPTEKFFNMVHELVMSHVIEGAEPPREIHSAIMNVADDMMAGREVSLRSGDYIELMNYARAKKIL